VYTVVQRRSKPLKNGTASFFSLQKSGMAKAMFGRTSFKSGTAGFLIEFLTTSYIGYILFIIIKSTSLNQLKQIRMIMFDDLYLQN